MANAQPADRPRPARPPAWLPGRRSLPSLTAVIAHPADVVRAGVAALVATGGGFQVADATSPLAILRAPADHRPDVVLFDFTPREGRDACRLLDALTPRPTLVALVARAEEIAPADCYAAGADAAIALDTVTVGGFLTTLDLAVEGRGPVSIGFPARAAGTREATTATDDDGPLAGLTRRERELLYLIGQGCSNREIADALTVSIKTVETHRANLARKLDTRSRAGLMRLALSAGAA